MRFSDIVFSAHDLNVSPPSARFFLAELISLRRASWNSLGGGAHVPKLQEQPAKSLQQQISRIQKFTPSRVGGAVQHK